MFKRRKNITDSIPEYNIQDNSNIILFGFGTSFLIINQNKNAKYLSFVYPSFFYDRLHLKYYNYIDFIIQIIWNKN